MKTEYDVLIVGAGVVGIYLSKCLEKRGLTVLLIDKGGCAEGLSNAAPILRFSERVNESAVQARNHVVGGNSRYWGGALVSDDGTLFDGLFANHNDKSFFPVASNEVYRTIGIRGTRRTTPFQQEGYGRFNLCEFPVLTGRSRHLWDAELNKDKRLTILRNTVLERLKVSSKNSLKYEAAILRTASGEPFRIRLSAIVITAGVIDTLLVIAGMIKRGEIPPHSLLGMGLHDHLSLPILHFPWNSTNKLRTLFPPTFEKSVTIGRRVEFSLSEEESVKGFFHIQAPFDDVEPFVSLKALVFAKQRSLSSTDCIRIAFRLLKSQSGRPTQHRSQMSEIP